MPFTVGPSAYEHMASFFDEAIAHGQLPDPGLDVVIDDSNKANSTAYIQVIRSRLIDLGYMGDTADNRSSTQIDRTLKAAIRKFQTEAGQEVVDAWAGPKTFLALQQLVSFEDEQDPENWTTLKNNLHLPAVSRAVYLRLYSLGFFDWKEKLNTRTDVSLSRNHKFKTALSAFLKTAFELNAINAHLGAEINIDVLCALFQQDEMIRLINKQQAFILNPDNKRFLDSVARIELWLIGYDINIGNPKTIYKRRKIYNKRAASRARKKTTKLAVALEDFWANQPVDRQPVSKKMRQTVRPEFFASLCELSSDESDSDAAHNDVVRHVQQLSKAESIRLQNTLQGVASSIWDGVKRVFRWIKHFVSKVVKTSINVIKNIARYIARRARSAFEIAEKATEILHRATVYLRHEYLPGSHPKHIVIMHDNDFDTRTFLNLAGDNSVIKQLLLKNLKESSYLKSACIILSHLISILQQVAKGFSTGVVGWFLILLALCRIRLNIKGVVEEVENMKVFEIERHASPYINLVI